MRKRGRNEKERVNDQVLVLYLQCLEVFLILTSVHYKQEYGRSYGSSLEDRKEAGQ